MSYYTLFLLNPLATRKNHCRFYVPCATIKNMIKQIIRYLFSFLIIAVLAAAVFLSLQWGCPLLNITGIPCPGCGMTRAFLAFFRLDLKGAFHYHPMFLMLLALPALFVICLIRQVRIYRRQGAPWGRAVLQNASVKLLSSKISFVLLFFCLFGYLAVYIARVILPLWGLGDPSALHLLRGCTNNYINFEFVDLCGFLLIFIPHI
jgi:hypothetical protein